jgi:hypothetical protein
MIECSVHPEEKVCLRECAGTSHFIRTKEKEQRMWWIDITPKSYFGTCDFQKCFEWFRITRQSFPADTALWAVVGLNVGIFSGCHSESVSRLTQCSLHKKEIIKHEFCLVGLSGKQRRQQRFLWTVALLDNLSAFTELQVSSQKALHVSLFCLYQRHFRVKLRLYHHCVVRYQVPGEERGRNMWRVGGYCFAQAVAYRPKVDGLPGRLVKGPTLPHFNLLAPEFGI